MWFAQAGGTSIQPLKAGGNQAGLWAGGAIVGIIIQDDEHVVYFILVASAIESIHGRVKRLIRIAPWLQH